ncbi:cytochrome b5 domain-containing protein [Patescibacteria group bacterium]
MKRIITFILISFSLIIFLGCDTMKLSTNSNQEEEKTETTEDTEKIETAETKEIKDYNMEEIAKHNSMEDCWLLIHDKVYDVSDYFTDHPGTDAMLDGCGKESTELFETRPMGSGTPHSNDAREIMTKYYIGNLLK